MKYRIVLTQLAQADIREAVTWWRDHRSSDQAERWYDQIYPAMYPFHWLLFFVKSCTVSMPSDAAVSTAL